MGYPIVTGKDWIVANWNKASAMETLSKKISNPSCGILLDDNVLQSCGQCDAYTSKDGCPAPWGSSKSDLENPNIDFVKKAYGCSLLILIIYLVQIMLGFLLDQLILLLLIILINLKWEVLV